MGKSNRRLTHFFYRLFSNLVRHGYLLVPSLRYPICAAEWATKRENRPLHMNDPYPVYRPAEAVLFVNGLPPKSMPPMNRYTHVYCTDGAFAYLNGDIAGSVDYIVGDMDSLSSQSYVPSSTRLVTVPDQDHTDFEKALRLIADHGHQSVHVFGSSGKEHDHFLGNLAVALQYQHILNLQFFDNYQTYFFANRKEILDVQVGSIVSLMPFPTAREVSTTGLKYPLRNEELCVSHRIGIRNSAISSRITVEHKEGNLLIFI